MNEKEKILEILSNNKIGLRKFGVRRIGIFGSAASGLARADSDLDVIVELENKSFDAYMDLKFFLEELFGKKVDLVIAETIKPRLKASITGEAVYAAGF